MTHSREIAVHQWIFRPLEQAAIVVLSETEFARAATIAAEQRRLAYVRSRSLLRRALARYLSVEPGEVTIESDALGKPRLADHDDVGFSISHSGDWFIVAIADGEIGIDIETQLPRVDPITLARRFFSPADFLILDGANSGAQGEMFRRQWVAKESAVKTAGTGLANILEHAECKYRDGAIEGVSWGDRRFTIHEFELADGTPGAVATEGSVAMKIVPHDARDLLS